MRYTTTGKLKKLLEKNEKPEEILIFIYKNVFKLMKEIDKDYWEINGGNAFSSPYVNYYRAVILNSEEVWLKTIFPPYIKGFKNFYQGIAGRLEYFSINLVEEAEKINKLDNNWDVYFRYHFHSILSETPDTYYWYGNPENWAFCYDIRFVSYYFDIQQKMYLPELTLDKKKEIIIKKRQFIFIDNSKYDNAWEKMFDGKERTTDIDQILVVYKALPEDYSLSIDNLKYPDPMRRFYRSNDEDIMLMVEDYKNNVTKENGYNLNISKIWCDYNQRKVEINQILNRKDTDGELKHFKIRSEEENKELEDDFISKYK